MSVLKNTMAEKFSQLPNQLIEDIRISAKAFRVAAYLFSRPSGWEVRNADIMNRLSINDEGSLAKYWKELISSGWLTRTRIKDADGIYRGGFDYQLNLSPTIEDAKIGDCPNREKSKIRQKSQLGKKQDSFSNTDFSSNTDSFSNTEKTPLNSGGGISESDIEDFEAELKCKKSEAQKPPRSAAPPKCELSEADFSGFDQPLAALTHWLVWEQYKKQEKKGTYKKLETKKAAINQLLKLSGGKSEIARQIIEQSRANLWSGLFELSQKNKPMQALTHNPQIIDSNRYKEYERSIGTC